MAPRVSSLSSDITTGISEYSIPPPVRRCTETMQTEDYFKLISYKMQLKKHRGVLGFWGFGVLVLVLVLNLDVFLRLR